MNSPKIPLALNIKRIFHFFTCRLQEKILDVESENKILRQKSLIQASGHLPPTPVKGSQNGHFSSKESPFNGSEIETLARTQEQESDAKTRRYHLDRQRVWFLVELLPSSFF
jgi:myosin-5